MTDSPFTLRPDGVIVLVDDDGDPCYYLQPAHAVELGEFIRDNEREIEQRATAQRSKRAWVLIGASVSSGLPAPRSVDVNWDGKLTLSVGDHLDAWVQHFGDTVREDDTHPTLGTRPTASNATFVIQGEWDPKPADAAAAAA